MTKDELKNIVAFCALMEGNGGIVGKAPTYILEKYKRYVAGRGDAPLGLDGVNTAKFHKWCETWL